MARSLRAEGMAWRDVAQEIAWSTGRRFSFDAIQSACYRNKIRLSQAICAEVELSFVHDGVIAALWRLGFDTYEIAKRIDVREHHVANRLPDILQTILREDQACSGNLCDAAAFGAVCVRAEGLRFEINGNRVCTVAPDNAIPSKTGQMLALRRARW